MEKIQKKIKTRQKANNKKNYNLSHQKIPSKQKDGRGHHQRQGGNTASRAVANSATITCTVVKDPNSEQMNRFAVISYPDKGIDGEILGPFEKVHEVVGSALDYLQPLFDDTTENLYIKFTDGATRRYAILGGKIQHG